MQKLFGCDGDGVEVAEAHGFLVLGVMAGRANEGEAVLQFAGSNLKGKHWQFIFWLTLDVWNKLTENVPFCFSQNLLRFWDLVRFFP